MEKKDHDERRVVVLDQEDDDEEEEALSFSDLPLIHHPREDQDRDQDKINRSPQSDHSKIHEQDFDFCSRFEDSEMCAADEVFFQGRIVPLRHSISYERELSTRKSVSRSESMDYSYRSSSLVSSISSRSSSINSTNSSGSTFSATTTVPKCYRYKPKPLQPRNNQFQYFHPSPSPRLTTVHNARNRPKKSSSAWNILKLGLVKTPPEILNSSRPCPNNVKNFISSRSSSSKNSTEKKKPQMVGLFGSCKCSITSVAEVKRSANHSEVKALLLDDGEEGISRSKTKVMKRKQMSHHRTFEWLKQLSISEDDTKLSLD